MGDGAVSAACCDVPVGEMHAAPSFQVVTSTTCSWSVAGQLSHQRTGSELLWGQALSWAPRTDGRELPCRSLLANEG